MNPTAVAFMLGSISMCCFVASLFFVRFYVTTRDRLFMFFAAAFFIEGINRCILALLTDPKEGNPAVYGIRFIAYLLILAAILDKNRRST